MTSSKRASKNQTNGGDPAELEKLVISAQGGDKNAFAQIIATTQNRLFRFCLFLCGDRAFAEDLCQETYLRAYSRLDGLTKTQSFLDWSFRIAKNLYIDHVRSAKSREDELDTESLESITSEGGDLAEILAVQRVLSQFEPEDRYLLILVEVEGRSYKEAADLLEVSEDAVRSRLFRLRQSFLEKWQKN